MLDGELATLWRDRIPTATIFGFLLSCAGVAMLYLSKRALTHENIRVSRGYFEKRESSILYDLDDWLMYLTIAFGILSGAIILFGFMTSGDFRARLFRHKLMRFIGIAIAVIANDNKWEGKKIPLLNIFISKKLALATCGLICWWMNHFEYYTQYYYYGKCAEYECELQSYTKFGWIGTCMNMAITNLILKEDEDPQEFTICDKYDMFRYCKLYLPLLETHFLKIFASFCVILCGHTIYCMCMAANYVKIRCQSKFEELEELESLELSDISSDLD